MMQETGNNIDTHKSLSILINKDGLSFYVNSNKCGTYYISLAYSEEDFTDKVKRILHSIFDREGGFMKANVITYTSNYMSIPDSIFDNTRTHSYLSAKGISVDKSLESIIVSKYNAIVYLWVINHSFIDIFNKLFAEVVYLHPLLLGYILCDKIEHEDYVLMDLTHSSLAITVVKNKQLVIQEFVPTNSDNDTKFYIATLINNVKFVNKPQLLTTGFMQDKLLAALKTYYPEIVSIPITDYI